MSSSTSVFSTKGPELKMLKTIQEKIVATNYYLNKSAKDAYRSYILAYNSHSMKDIFNVHRLDLQVSSLSLWIL